MIRKTGQRAVAGGLVGLALAAAPLLAHAGGGPGDESSRQESGTHFFGDAKDVKGFAPLEGVRVKVAIAGTRQFLVVLTDADGRFRLEGFGKDLSVDKVDVSCDKDGYRTVEALRRPASRAKGAPIVVECLLARKKS